jgi:hypothetical protein
LVIVEETELPFLQRSRQVRRLLRPKVGTDLLVYTPDEFEQMSRERLFFRDEILAIWRWPVLFFKEWSRGYEPRCAKKKQ